jgi:uncharacterized membrane protein
VFGFAIAQLALQLDLPKVPSDLYGHPIKYVLYFGTFTLLALLWLAFHRMLTGTYRPTRIDLIITFGYLAFVGLVPYAMYANVHFAGKTDSAALGLATYLTCAFGTAATASAISFRNAARGRGTADLVELRGQWRFAVATGYVSGVMLVAAVVDLTLGVLAAAVVTMLAPGARLAARRLQLPAAWQPVPVSGTSVPPVVS